MGEIPERPAEDNNIIESVAETEASVVEKLRPPLVSMFLRSFLLQTLMNYTRMQGLGFGNAMIPVARRVRLKARDLAGFLRRHLDFFNAHPYLASYALGAAARLEMEGQKPAKIIELKSRLMGPLGMLGDQVFWAKWKPLCSVIAVILLLSISWPPQLAHRSWSIAVLAGVFIVYNILHLSIRWRGLKAGFQKGDKVHEAISGSIIVKLRFILGLCAAFFGGLYLVKTITLSANSLVFAVSFIVVLASRWRRGPLWLALILAMTFSLLLYFITELRLSE